jgi:hypothetical protein
LQARGSDVIPWLKFAKRAGYLLAVGLMD